MAVDKQITMAGFGPYLYDSAARPAAKIETVAGVENMKLEHDGLTVSDWTASKFLMTNVNKKTITGDLDALVSSPSGTVTISGNELAVTTPSISKSFLSATIIDTSQIDITTFDWSGSYPYEVSRALVIAHGLTGGAKNGTVAGWIEFIFGKYFDAFRTSFIIKIAGDANSGVYNTDGTGGAATGIDVFSYVTSAQLRIQNQTGGSVQFGIAYWKMQR